MGDIYTELSHIVFYYMLIIIPLIFYRNYGYFNIDCKPESWHSNACMSASSGQIKLS